LPSPRRFRRCCATRTSCRARKCVRRGTAPDSRLARAQKVQAFLT
jgi:hypothetical protein